jgi:NADH:ubiquinone oxidoreductase subunit 5 (subunit L)/multisubunit Na+/H+ antiporter MnhA subunit
VVLAIGTLVSSYALFRPLIADAAGAATAGPLVLAIDGGRHTAAINAAHHWLTLGVGLAFLVGFGAALAIYGRGLAAAEAIKRTMWPAYTVLEHKYYFDEVYNAVWVKGCLLFAGICRFADTYIVDFVFDLAAMTTERLAAISGLILDNQGVDGIINGMAKTSWDIGGVLRTPQTGRIRNYVLFATAAATMILIGVLWLYGAPAAASP